MTIVVALIYILLSKTEKSITLIKAHLEPSEQTLMHSAHLYSIVAVPFHSSTLCMHLTQAVYCQQVTCRAEVKGQWKIIVDITWKSVPLPCSKTSTHVRHYYYVNTVENKHHYGLKYSSNMYMYIIDVQ